jgi:hypothetical protein
MEFKDEAIQAISSLPGTASLDDIMYRLYVLDKVRKGQEAIKNGHTLTVDQLKKEMIKW